MHLWDLRTQTLICSLREEHAGPKQGGMPHCCQLLAHQAAIERSKHMSHKQRALNLCVMVLSEGKLLLPVFP